MCWRQYRASVSMFDERSSEIARLDVVRDTSDAVCIKAQVGAEAAQQGSACSTDTGDPVIPSHESFLIHLGRKAYTWLSKFFSGIIGNNRIPKEWRKTKVIAIEKPGKDPKEAANYRPISLLSVSYKLLERLVLMRITPTVEALLSPDQAGFDMVVVPVIKLPH